MWRAEVPWCLLVGSDRVACGPVPGRRGSGGDEPSELLLPAPTTDGHALADLIATLQGLVHALPSAQRKGSGVLHVLVSDRWLAMTSLPWSADLHRPETMLAYACEQLASAGVELTAADAVRVSDAPYRALRCALAYPASLLLAIESFATAAGLRTQSIQSLSLQVAASQHLADSPAAVAVIEDRVATLLQRAAGRWLPLGAPVLVDPGADMPQMVSMAWRRARLRQPALGARAGLPVLDLRSQREPEGWQRAQDLVPVATSGGRPSDPWPLLAKASMRGGGDLNAVGRRKPAGLAALALLALTALVAAGALVQAIRALEQRRALEHAIAQRAAPVEPPSRVVRSREEEAREAAVNLAIAQLNVPVETLLAALPPPRDIRVALLGAEVQAGRGGAATAGQLTTLKLVGESPTSAEMARYVAFLADRKPFVSAYLVNHEVLDGAAAASYRFTVEAAWRD